MPPLLTGAGTVQYDDGSKGQVVIAVVYANHDAS